jgi:hypothetical protein
MALLNIPIKRDAASWTQRMTLDGLSYTLDFAWNGREEAWYLGIYDATGAPLVLSRKIVTNRPLLKRLRFITGLPAGELFASDPSGQIDAAGYDELGTAVKLIYFERVELA